MFELDVSVLHCPIGKGVNNQKDVSLFAAQKNRLNN
jgi:hypothetical protein